MEIPVYNKEGQEISKTELSDSIFGVPMNHDLLFQVVTSQISNKRQVIAHAKGRSEVRGGGVKPWRQKGTGRARHGSIRSPIWKGGGATFGPTKERNFEKKINKKMAQKALKVALSAKVRDGQIVIMDDIALNNPKTKEMAQFMKGITSLFQARNATRGSIASVLLVTPDLQQPIKRATQNLPYMDTIEARNLNPHQILAHTFLLMPKSSIEAIQNWLGKKKN